MRVVPIAITQVQWSGLIDLCQKVLGYSPTRGIDGTTLDVKDPAAYLGSLDLNNDPVTRLRNPDCSFRHFSASFAVSCDTELLLSLQNKTQLVIHSKGTGSRILAIVSGDMLQWYEAVIHGCSEDVDYIHRSFMNEILKIFKRVGFREIFNNYKSATLIDGTFLLRG